MVPLDISTQILFCYNKDMIELCFSSVFFFLRGGGEVRHGHITFFDQQNIGIVQCHFLVEDFTNLQAFKHGLYVPS